LRPLFSTPAIAAPVFAAMLLVIGFQNLVTFPALRTATMEPRLLPSVPLHAGTRSGDRPVVEADRKLGVILRVEVPDQSAYSSYTVDLYDPAGKLAWTRNFSSAAIGAQDDSFSLMLPGSSLRQGSYQLAISGIKPGDSLDQRSLIGRQFVDIHLKD
jgi:hypothetical protein